MVVAAAAAAAAAADAAAAAVAASWENFSAPSSCRPCGLLAVPNTCDHGVDFH